MAHFTLYHNVEINLTSPETLSVFVTIHQSDLENTDDETFIRETFQFPREVSFRTTYDRTSPDLPEGCHLAILEARNPGGELSIRLSPQSEKRLLLVVSRPGAFPETKDLPPGASHTITLPDPPSVKRTNPWIGALLVAAAIGIALLLRRWRLASLAS